MSDTLYLAGPMTGLPEYNFPAFLAAARHLRAAGWKVSNPAEDCLNEGFDPKVPPQELTRPAMDKIRARCLWRVMNASALCLLPGWEQSKGARAEHALAVWREIPVYTYHDPTRPENAGRLSLLEAHPAPSPALEGGGETILEEAARITDGARLQDYCHPYEDFTTTAALWSALLASILSRPITGKEAILCMVLLKISRESRRHKRDNLVDMAGYPRALEKYLERDPHLPRADG